MITIKTPLKNILNLAPACNCHECKHGCTVGSGFLAKDDKKNIAKFLDLSEKELEEKYLEETELFNKKIQRPKILRNNKPYGKCIFYDDGCTIHKVKPLQCKISMGCKEYGQDLNIWFMLKHIIDFDDPESIRQYAQYLTSGGKTIEGGSIEKLIPDKHKLKKILDYSFLR